MTYQAQETSIEAGQPVELYVFQIGTDTYRYTSAEDIVTFAAQSYLPRQIERSDPTQADQERRQELKITMPADDLVCSRFIGVVPGQALFLDLLRFHRGDTEAYNVWSGKVIGATFKKQGAVCEMSGVTSEAALNRNIPRFKYQGICNHVLYDTNCKVNKDSFKYTDNISSVSGATVTINGISAAKGAGWAVGGYIDYGSADYRLVTAQSGDTLTLVLPFAADMVGETVDVYAGCDHTLTTCESKFSNNLNYGGFAFVPTLNPFNVSLV